MAKLAIGQFMQNFSIPWDGLFNLKYQYLADDID